MGLKKLIAKSPLKDSALKTMGIYGHMPKYFIAGVGRSGTTTLYDYMNQHPQINPSRQKECQFFDSNYSKGFYWYKGHFPKPNCIDATPSYYHNPVALDRIDITYPETPKFIVILREPIARLESVINFALSRGDKYSWDDYVNAGIYHKHLRNMFHLFGEENIHVMFLEELQRDPIGELGLLFDVLGLEHFQVKPLEKINAGIYSRRLTRAEKDMLEETYDPANEELKVLLNRELPY